VIVSQDCCFIFYFRKLKIKALIDLKYVQHSHNIFENSPVMQLHAHLQLEVGFSYGNFAASSVSHGRRGSCALHHSQSWFNLAMVKFMCIVSHDLHKCMLVNSVQLHFFVDYAQTYTLMGSYTLCRLIKIPSGAGEPMPKFLAMT
jgi:hypothetical protein